MPADARARPVLVARGLAGVRHQRRGVPGAHAAPILRLHVRLLS